jgi:hypothetical protein
MVTLPVRKPPETMSEEAGLTEVQVDKGLDVCPAEPKNRPLAVKAAEVYRAMGTVE